MGKLETLTVDISEDLAAGLRAAVERGDYASVSEAVSDALDNFLPVPGAETPAETERLRRAVEEGIASGVSEARTMDEILTEARRRFDAVALDAGPASRRRGDLDLHRVPQPPCRGWPSSQTRRLCRL